MLWIIIYMAQLLLLASEARLIPAEAGFLGTPAKIQDFEILTTYTDSSGAVRAINLRSSNISDSWEWVNPTKDDNLFNDSQMFSRSSKRHMTCIPDYPWQNEVAKHLSTGLMSPMKYLRQKMRQKRRVNRTTKLIKDNMSMQYLREATVMQDMKQLDVQPSGKLSLWRREFGGSLSDSLLELMKDQITMAKAYLSFESWSSDINLSSSLKKCIDDSLDAIRDANSDYELKPRVLESAKVMGHVLAVAKDKLFNCNLLSKKLRAMLQFREETIAIQKKQSNFLIQHAAKTVPKSLHCLSLHLAADYVLFNSSGKEEVIEEKLTDPTLYHYSIFSDNVLASSVVVNSTVLSAKEPEKHVFHIVTDRLHIAAMRMWFIANSPEDVTVDVANIDDLKWLNSSYCSVLRQLESSELKEFYFKTQHLSSLSAGTDNLKYRNPKYLSMLNHLRFYLPEVYPKLDKIMFLDDDIVVQKDLTPLWSINLSGMVIGAVETCKGSFHRFDKYLNFSNPWISENFDPNACGWAFGMNIIDLNEWRKRNITGIYHYWQDLNVDRTLWKLGSLPPGLITFYNLTYPLDRGWHALGLGYDPALNETEIAAAAVIHFNGNYKPWLELAYTKYKSYWSKFLRIDNPYLLRCHIS